METGISKTRPRLLCKYVNTHAALDMHTHIDIHTHKTQKKGPL